MKILIVTYQFPPVSSGGISYISFNLYKSFRKLDHDVHVLAFGSTSVLDDYPGVERLGTSPLEFLFHTYRNSAELKLSDYDVILIQHSSGAGLINHLKKIKHQNTIAIIHVSTYQEMKSIIPARGYSGKIIGNPTFDEYAVKYVRSPILLILEHYVFKNVKKIVCTGEFTTCKAIRDYKIDPKRIKNILNGADFGNFYYKTTSNQKFNIKKKGKKILLFVGVLRRIRKGVYHLIEFFSFLRKERQDIELVIIGEGRHETNIGELIKKYNLDQSVSIFGPVNNHDLPYFYSQADATIVPSTYEGFPMVILESLACGTPVAATELLCHKEIINENNGVLLSDYDPCLWMNAVFELLDKNHKRESVKSSIDHLSWDNIAIQYLNWAN